MNIIQRIMAPTCRFSRIRRNKGLTLPAADPPKLPDLPVLPALPLKGKGKGGRKKASGDVV